MSSSIYESLYRVSQLFNSILDPELLFERVIAEALTALNAERGLIMLRDDKTGSMTAIASEARDSSDFSLSEISQTALQEVLADGQARVYLDAPDAFPKAQSVIIGHVRSIAIAPLVTRGRLIGAIYIDSRTDRNVLHEDALSYLSAFANIAALAIDNARLYRTLTEESSQLRATLGEWQQFPEIIGHSEAMQGVYRLMNRLLVTDAAVIISGETGTGKEMVARAIHYNGTRRTGPFVPVNCGAFPEALFESELFGYRKGSFTGAVADRQGLIEAANGGSLFLDEVGDLPLPLQPKLLRTLQSGEVRRVGDSKPFHVDVRVISATNQDLPGLVKAGRFREDLFYRLNVVPIELPPLRRRRDDIPLLVNTFIQRQAVRLKKQVEGISRAALARLVEYNWPGNVRQLENVIERAVVLCTGPRIEESDILITEPSARVSDDTATVAEIEKRVVLERLRQFGGNRTRTAASLGISRRTLLNKLAEWRVEEGSRDEPENGTL